MMMVVIILYLGKGSGLQNAVQNNGVLFFNVGVSSQPPHAPYSEESSFYHQQFQLVDGPLQILGWTFPITLRFCKGLTPIFTQPPTHNINIYFMPSDKKNYLLIKKVMQNQYDFNSNSFILNPNPLKMLSSSHVH